MDKKKTESIFDLSMFVIGSSRTVYDETTRYAAFRMLQIFQRIADLKESEDDRFLKEMSEEISKNDEVLMRGSPGDLVGFLDSLVSRAAEELKKRNQESK